MRDMPVAFVPPSGRKRAPQSPQTRIFLKQFADRVAMPARGKRVWQSGQVWCRSRGRDRQRTKRGQEPCHTPRSHGQ